MGQIKLVLDNDVLAEYNEYYFSMHPRAKKIPIEKPWHPSLNKWMILPRISMNNLKQTQKTFGVWWINKLGYADLKLEHFKITSTIYFDTHMRHDCDNYTIKFEDDFLTESGMIVDDDSKHLYSLTLQCDYDKNHPRQEILIEYDEKEN